MGVRQDGARLQKKNTTITQVAVCGTIHSYSGQVSSPPSGRHLDGEHVHAGEWQGRGGSDQRSKANDVASAKAL